MVIDEATQIEILEYFAADPCTSLRKFADITLVEFVHKITRLHTFHPYKIQILIALNEDDNNQVL